MKNILIESEWENIFVDILPRYQRKDILRRLYLLLGLYPLLRLYIQLVHLRHHKPTRSKYTRYRIGQLGVDVVTTLEVSVVDFLSH